ncbi:FeoB-associated Cys-rich membrane protein [Clostridium tepidiprofundi]|uniref:FeoB-associated Cys-rich membrane protein n=1 Tax=Clostridium tepidiprofundi TaxID=420412 RepID=UPI0009FD059C|nr:FeoB-associated Cys-rich membrane protein [Clostridium tepidiprofundi]
MFKYIFLVGILLFSVYLIYRNIKKQIKGEGGCGGHSCANCPNKCAIQTKKEKED